MGSWGEIRDSENPVDPNDGELVEADVIYFNKNTEEITKQIIILMLYGKKSVAKWFLEQNEDKISSRKFVELSQLIEELFKRLSKMDG